jgi:hypothetical protein
MAATERHWEMEKKNGMGNGAFHLSSQMRLIRKVRSGFTGHWGEGRERRASHQIIVAKYFPVAC